MKLLGVDLRFPDTSNLIAALVAGGVLTVIFLALTAFNVLPALYASMLSASSVGGALANAFGASIKETGWRGAVLSSGFSAILMGFVYLFWFVF